MKVKSKRKPPPVKVRFTGKEVKALLNEFDNLAELFRFDPSIDTPTLDEFTAKLEEAISDF